MKSGAVFLFGVFENFAYFFVVLVDFAFCGVFGEPTRCKHRFNKGNMFLVSRQTKRMTMIIVILKGELTSKRFHK